MGPTSSFISQPGHCLCHTLSLFEQQIPYLISLDFKTALKKKKAQGGDAAAAGGKSRVAPGPETPTLPEVPGSQRGTRCWIWLGMGTEMPQAGLTAPAQPQGPDAGTISGGSSGV